MAALHTKDDLFTPRHTTSWLLLAASAGGVNAVGFLACERFVSHVTGTATRLGVEGPALHLVGDYLAVIASFLLGAMASVLAIQGRLLRGRRPWYAAPLVAVAVLLAGVGFAGDLGLFGPFGGDVDEATDVVLLCLLGLAMGLQNAAVTTATGAVVRTTHMTGPTTDLGIQLATALVTDGDARAEALRQAGLRAGKIGAFIAGGAVMVPVAETLGFLSLLVPAAVVLLTTARSFMPSGARLDALARPIATTHPRR